MKLALVFTSFLTGIIVVGCAQLVEDEAAEPTSATAESESELPAFVPGDLVGLIACGQTKRVHHDGAPTYRALSISATKGQALDIKVSAIGADARAWLTTASNTAVASNDDSGGSRDSHITYTAKS